MKKTLAILLTVLMVTGCAGMDADRLTSEQKNLVAEYAAGLVIKHDRNHDAASVSDIPDVVSNKEVNIVDSGYDEKEQADESIAEHKLEPLTEQQTDKSKEEADEPSGPAEEMQIEEEEFSQILGLSDCTIQYRGYEVCGYYPNGNGQGEEGIVVNATAGTQLCVFKFQIHNRSSQAQVCDMLSADMSFGFMFNGETNVPVVVSLLHNDMSVICETIAAGASTEAILLCEVDADLQSVIKEVDLLVYKNGISGLVKLQ